MEIQQKPVNFEDERGSIRDILTHDSIQHLTVITSKKGAVRGHHYHKETTQYEYVVSGSLKILSQKPGEEVVATIAGPDSLISHDPMEAHALIALEDTIFLAITKGVRGGVDYEQDTFRLDVPLEDPTA